jgi:3-hydroxyacyl-[acyl-carrier-protein] dehydratase
MRWFWIDRFEEFVRGSHAVTIKAVTVAEEPLDDYQLGHPHYPHSLMIEGMAQTGGLLIAEPIGFSRKVVLAKVGKAVFHRCAYPGDLLRLTATIQDIQDSGAVVTGTIDVNGERIADMELWFAFLDERFGEGPLFPLETLLRTLRWLRMYEVARDEHGNKITPHPTMLDAERKSLDTTTS